MFRRMLLFFLTNLLVMITIGIMFNVIISVLGINRMSGYLPYLIVFSAVWGMGGAFISLLLSKVMAKFAMGVQIIDPKMTGTQYADLVSTVHHLARKAGLSSMPEVGVYDSPEINAFATGPTRNNSLVAVSTGLLARMNKDEVEGVLGHEVAHIANGDMVTMTLIQGVVNAFVLFLSRIAAMVLAQNVEEKNRGMTQWLATIVFDIVFTILGSIVVFYFSRIREFRADAGGAHFAGRQKMIAGLQRLKSQVEEIAPDNSGMATLKISNRPSGFMSLFSTHPSLDERIARLQSMQGS